MPADETIGYQHTEWVLRPGSGSGRTWPRARRSPRWRWSCWASCT